MTEPIGTGFSVLSQSQIIGLQIAIQKQEWHIAIDIIAKQDELLGALSNKEFIDLFFGVCLSAAEQADSVFIKLLEHAKLDELSDKEINEMVYRVASPHAIWIIKVMDRASLAVIYTRIGQFFNTDHAERLSLDALYEYKTPFINDSAGEWEGVDATQIDQIQSRVQELLMKKKEEVQIKMEAFIGSFLHKYDKKEE